MVGDLAADYTEVQRRAVAAAAVERAISVLPETLRESADVCRAVDEFADASSRAAVDAAVRAVDTDGDGRVDAAEAAQAGAACWKVLRRCLGRRPPAETDSGTSV
jgi:aspartokinase-like uncharacterized kinase